MRVSLHGLALLFALSVRAPLFAQTTPGDTLLSRPTRISRSGSPQIRLRGKCRRSTVTRE